MTGGYHSFVWDLHAHSCFFWQVKDIKDTKERAWRNPLGSQEEEEEEWAIGEDGGEARDREERAKGNDLVRGIESQRGEEEALTVCDLGWAFSTVCWCVKPEHTQY